MINFGSGLPIAGGFYGTRMLTGYYLHGPDGQLLDSGIFQDFSGIDPPEPTTTTTLEPDGLPSAPISVLITVVDTPALPSEPTNLSITVEDS
jgi:hypothetical protein